MRLNVKQEWDKSIFRVVRHLTLTKVNSKYRTCKGSGVRRRKVKRETLTKVNSKYGTCKGSGVRQRKVKREAFLSDVGFDKLVDSGNVRALPAIGKVSFFGI